MNPVRGPSTNSTRAKLPIMNIFPLFIWKVIGLISLVGVISFIISFSTIEIIECEISIPGVSNIVSLVPIGIEMILLVVPG